VLQQLTAEHIDLRKSNVNSGWCYADAFALRLLLLLLTHLSKSRFASTADMVN
jgi:hypothetical protein